MSDEKKKDPLGLDNFQYDDGTLARYFGSKSSARLAQQLMHEQPLVYKQMKAEAAAKGWIQPEAPLSVRRQKQREITPEMAAAMQEFPVETCNAFFRLPPNDPNSRNAAKLASVDPAAYQRLKLASKGHNVLSDVSVTIHDNSHAGQLRERQKQQKALELEKGDVFRFPLSDDLAAKAGLKSGTMVTADDLITVNGLIQRNQKAAQEAAAHAAKNEPTAIDTNKPDGDAGDQGVK